MAQFDIKQVKITFSTGLTLTGVNLTVNLSAGVAGGQSVIGGTASGDALALSSTSHATKGKINFGSAGTSFFDEANNYLKIVTAGLGVTSTLTAGIYLSNTTAAGAAAQQISPPIILEGFGWKTTSTAGSQSIKVQQFVLPVQGTANPTLEFHLQDSVNAGAFQDLLILTDNFGATTVNTTTMRFGSPSGTNIMYTQISNNSSSINSGLGFFFAGVLKGGLFINGQAGEFRLFGASGGFVTTIFANGVEAMRLDTSQNIGMGAPPLTKLHITGNATNEALLRFTPSANTNFIGLEWTTSSTTTIIGQIKLNASTGEMKIGGSSSYFPTFYSGGGEGMRLAVSLNLLIGTTTDVASSLLTMASTSKGFLLPRMTTTQKNAISSPAEGLEIYDTTLHKKCVYTGSAWETVTSS